MAKFLKGIFAQLMGRKDSEQDINHLMFVLRETEGANKAGDYLSPIGQFGMVLSKPQQNKLDPPAWFSVIGDIHIRFVYDHPEVMDNLTYEEFA